MTLEEEFLSFLTKENAEIAAVEILDNFKNEECENPKSIIDFDFKISSGKMVSTKKSNTVLKFDCDEKSVIKEILNKISDPKIVPDDKLIQRFDFFRKIIATLLETKYKKKLIKKIEDNVFCDTGFFDIVIDRVEEIFIEEKPPIDYTMSIKKMTPKSVLNSNDRPEVDNQTLIKDLMTEHEKGLSFNDVIKKRKEEKDPNYTYVDSVETTKAYFECEVILSVDYKVKKVE